MIMAGITLTAAMRANLLSLQSTGKLLDQTQLRLSTGNKVNSALDNPINFFAAQSLNQRASSLSSLLDGMGQGIQTLQATNQAITTLTTLVKQLKSIANAAKTDLNNTTTVNTLMMDGGATGFSSAAVADLVTGGGITQGEAFSLQDGSGAVHTFTIDTVANGGVGTTLQDLVNAINGVDGLSASIVYGDGTTLSSADVDANGAADGAAMDVGLAYLKVVSLTGNEITATDIGAGNILAHLGLDGTSEEVITGGASGSIQSYKDVIAQIGQTVTDSNYQGNNLLAGTGSDLVIEVNELGTGEITITSVDVTAAGLGLDESDSDSWVDDTTVDATIALLDTALTTLSSKASGFANSLSLLQTRQDFTNNLINTLQDGSSLLTIADKNEEGANLLALQTQQQLGIEALSLSSQANQSVLRLFS
jgi:flagellin